MELVVAVVALGRISMFSGVNEHEDWSGLPVQDRVTNMGAVRAPASIGVTDAVTVPDCPAVRLSEAGATEI
jgi:hypothetical protein